MRTFIAIFSIIAVLLVGGCSSSKKDIALQGKFLNVALGDNIRTSDPTSQYDVVSGEVANQIYETPYQYDYYSDAVKIIPQLADGMPNVSPDGKTFTFKIKKGVRFQDDPCFKATQGKGRELVAQDFIYAWKRHYDPKNESQGLWIWEGKVESMHALDSHTVQLKLTKPYPQLLYVMTIMFTSPVPHEAVEFYGKDFGTHPVGTGPFKAKEFEPTSRVLLVRNENFREEFFPAANALGKKHKHLAGNAGKRLPLIDGIDFSIVKEEQPRWLGFLSGRYDQIKIPKDNFNQAIVQTQDGAHEPSSELKAKGMYLSIEPATYFVYAGISYKDSVLGKNKYLRQAIASAIDSKGWLEKFKNNRGIAQTEVSPPMVPDRCGKPYRWSFDIERAKKLIAKAGYPNGEGLPTLTWDTRGTDMTRRQTAEFMKINLAKIGIKLDINANTLPMYLEKSRTGNMQLSEGGWGMDYPDAENNYQLLYGPNAAPGPNEVMFDHKEFNKLYAQMTQMPSGPARRAVICKMEEILQEEVPWAYAFYENEYRLAHGWLKNFHTAELFYSKWKYVDIDMSLKQGFARN